MSESTTSLDRIEVLSDNSIQVREIVRTVDDNNEVSKVYHRYVLQENDDVSGKEQRIQDIAGVVWANA